VHTRVAEHLTQQLAGAVDDPGLAGEAGVARDEADHLDHLDDQVEVTDDRLDRRDRVQGAGAGQVLGLLGRDVGAHLAGRHEDATDHRQLARRPHQVAVTHGGHVRRQGRGDVWHLQAQLSQPRLDAAHARGRLR